ncbi:hypothetical protein GCM10009610_08450 [Pseudonocardia xinjiangensis]
MYEVRALRVPEAGGPFGVDSDRAAPRGESLRGAHQRGPVADDARQPVPGRQQRYGCRSVRPNGLLFFVLRICGQRMTPARIANATI